MRRAKKTRFALPGIDLAPDRANKSYTVKFDDEGKLIDAFTATKRREKVMGKERHERNKQARKQRKRNR